MKVVSRKRSFTLLEIIIAVAIISLVASVMIFPLSGMLGRHRFHQSVKQFVIHVKEMQAVALNHHSDMGIMVYREGGKLMCGGFTDEPMKLFRPFECQNISSLMFNERPVSFPFRLTIFSTGRVSPAGKLAFFSKDAAMEVNFSYSPHLTVAQLPFERVDQ